MFLEKSFCLKPLSIESMQLIVLFLELDGVSLSLDVKEDFECLVSFLVLLLQVEVDLCTKVFWAKVVLSDLIDNLTVSCVVRLLG